MIFRNMPPAPEDVLEADLRAAVPDIQRIFIEADQVVVRKG